MGNISLGHILAIAAFAGASAAVAYNYAKSKEADEKIALHQELALQLEEAAQLYEELAQCQKGQMGF